MVTSTVRLRMDCSLNKTCIFCSRPYQTTKVHGIWKRQKYCSARCREKHWLKLHPQQWKEYQVRLRKKKRLPCRECSKPLPFPSPGRKRHVRCHKKHRIRQSNISRRRLQQQLYDYKTKIGCSKCGYNNFGGALDFHHLDPATKERPIKARDWKNHEKRKLISDELKKCILLCSNCHREETFKGKNDEP